MSVRAENVSIFTIQTMMNTSSNDLMIADNRFISDTAFEKKGTKEKPANTRTFYLSQYDKGPFKLNCSKTPQGYDLAFDYFNTTDNKEIRKRIGQPKTYKEQYMHDYTLKVTNRTDDRLIVIYAYWNKDHFIERVPLSIAPHGEATGAGGTNGVVYYTEARPDADQNSDKLMPSY